MADAPIWQLLAVSALTGGASVLASISAVLLNGRSLVRLAREEERRRQHDAKRARLASAYTTVVDGSLLAYERVHQFEILLRRPQNTWGDLKELVDAANAMNWDTWLNLARLRTTLLGVVSDGDPFQAHFRDAQLAILEYGESATRALMSREPDIAGQTVLKFNQIDPPGLDAPVSQIGQLISFADQAARHAFAPLADNISQNLLDARRKALRSVVALPEVARERLEADSIRPITQEP